MKNIGGGTELFLESEEPEFETLEEFEELISLLSEGEYKFFGRSTEGDLLLGTATLTHVVTAGPEITSPAEGEAVDPENAVIAWNPVTRTFFQGWRQE